MLEDVFEELRTMRLCDSGNRFSLDWLRQNESYMRTLKFQKAKPSARVILRCAHRLQSQGQALSASDFPTIRDKGQRLNELAQACFNEAIRQSQF